MAKHSSYRNTVKSYSPMMHKENIEATNVKKKPYYQAYNVTVPVEKYTVRNYTSTPEIKQIENPSANYKPTGYSTKPVELTYTVIEKEGSRFGRMFNRILSFGKDLKVSMGRSISALFEWGRSVLGTDK